MHVALHRMEFGIRYQCQKTMGLYKCYYEDRHRKRAVLELKVLHNNVMTRIGQNKLIKKNKLVLSHDWVCNIQSTLIECGIT